MPIPALPVANFVVIQPAGLEERFTINSLGLPLQLGRDARTPITGPLQRDALDGIVQVHVLVWSSFGRLLKTIESGPAQLGHRNRQAPLGA